MKKPMDFKANIGRGCLGDLRWPEKNYPAAQDIFNEFDAFAGQLAKEKLFNRALNASIRGLALCAQSYLG